MDGLVTYLEELYKNSEIPFEIYVDNKNIFKTNPLLFSEKGLVENRFSLNNKLVIIQTYEKFKDSLKLIRFCIENKYKEQYNNKEKLILSLLKDEKVSNERMEDIAFSLQDTYLITIYLNEKIPEVIELLKTVYVDTDIIIIEYNNYAILVGMFEDIEEHVSSITETIYVDLYKKCYLSYCLVNDYQFIHQLYEDNIYKIKLAQKYNLSNKIFNEKSLLFESIIDGLNTENKLKIISKFNNGFDKLDSDIINTIEVFFNCDLNLSEASKKLYVHRNTLIYRLDKIKKYTCYDIRNFNEAILFKIAFFIWKEKKNCY